MAIQEKQINLDLIRRIIKFPTEAALSDHTHSGGGIGGISVDGTLYTSGTVVLSDIYQPIGEYLTTAAQSVHIHDYQSTGEYLTTAALSNHTHSQYQSTGNYLTTARASNDAIGLNTAGTSVTWTVNSSGISFNAGAYLTTAMVSQNTSLFQYTSATSVITASAMNTGERVNYFYTSNNTFANNTHSHGAITFNGTNISASHTSSSNGLTLNLSVANPGGGGGTSIVPGDWLSSSVDGSTLSLSVTGLQATSATSAITSNAFHSTLTTKFAGTGTTVGATDGTLFKMTLNSLGLNVSAPPYLTTAAISNHSHGFSASGGSSVFQTLNFADSNGITFSNTNASVRVIHGLQYTSATSAITASALNTNQSSLFQHTSATSVITASAMNTNERVNYFYTSNNTFANSTHSHGAFSGYNVTASTSSNGLTLSVAAPGAAAENNWFNLSGNTSNASTASGSTIVLSAGNNITLAASNGNIIKIEAGGGGAAPNRSFVEIMQGERLTRVFNASATQLSNRPFFIPFWLDGAGLAASTVRILVSFVTNTRPPVMTYGAAIYTTNNTSQLGLLCSTTATMDFVSSQSASFSGVRVLDITGMTTPIPDGRAILALFFSGAGTASMDFSLYGGDAMAPFVGFLSGASNTLATNNTNLFLPWWGRYSANSGSFPNIVAKTQIYGGRSADLVDLYAVIKQI